MGLVEPIRKSADLDSDHSVRIELAFERGLRKLVFWIAMLFFLGIIAIEVAMSLAR